MKVVKFGGTSVANATNIKKVVNIITGSNEPQIVIVSAFSGITDQLVQLGILAERNDDEYLTLLKELETKHLDAVRELVPVTTQSHCLSEVKQNINELEDICEGVFRLQEASLRTKDRILAFGELLSSKIISAYLQSLHISHEWIDARKVIKTNSHFGNAAVNFVETNKLITEIVAKPNLYLVPGFIASDDNGYTTTLGRGGSDYTAAIFAAAINASSLEIWTDVTGMMTADPRWVPGAKTIAATSYEAAMELSHFGAKVIYPPTIQPVMKKNIPTLIKNTFAPNEKGTIIQSSSASSSNAGGEAITGISSINNIALLSLEGSGMVGIPGFSKHLFEALASERINVILITQSSSEHSICVGVNASDTHKAKAAVDAAFEREISSGNVEALKIETGLSIIALVGDKMKSHPGISGNMFSALGRNGINIRAIAQGSSERNISAVISSDDVKKAVNVLHEAFFEATTYKQLNVFVVGTGNVGKKLIGQILQQQHFLEEHFNIQVRITGIANSKKMLFVENGNAIKLSSWQEQLAASENMNLDTFINTLISKNLRNSVFVDITANHQVADVYLPLLEKSISVVACNKVAASSAYKNYLRLKQTAKEFNTQYLFETNVGAGLPVIGTLSDLRKSGDVVNKIQAVLSGTLNFVFNKYDGTKPLAQIVKMAQDEGYTEPDPRLDLGGTDVMRKILILARETGEPLEMEAISNNGFLPLSCFEGSVDDFYKEMEKHEAHFEALYNEAKQKGCKLKFVAQYAEGKASVGLQHIAPDSDFYHLYGKDNAVLFYTQRYPEQPLVVKGAGAGADVTASGVFADIIRVAR
ncbi:MAG: bifunctional aspartate kinase/homoserine dehydrogenase I [Bacteroidota bacterium]|nr:bifunctional aspartate kinase/homoserine dehydrogenase I [Bacteroidota bacterium]